MALNGEFLVEMEEKAKRKAEEEAAKPPKKKRPRKKPTNSFSNSAGQHNNVVKQNLGSITGVTTVCTLL